jgi:hypothetical protein
MSKANVRRGGTILFYHPLSATGGQAQHCFAVLGAPPILGGE